MTVEIKVDNASVEKLIEGQIKLAAAEVLSKHSPELIKRLVNKALEQRRHNAYSGDPTIFEETVRKMIRTEALEATKVWIDEQRPIIRKMVYDAIRRKDNGLAQKIAEALVAGLAGDLNIKAYLSSNG